MGSKCPNSLHEFILPENVVISYFSDVEMPLKCPKVELGGQKSQNFSLKWGIKFENVPQTPQFFMENFVLISPCLLFTQNIHI